MINRPRDHGLYSGEERAEIILLDGTGSERLNHLVFGYPVHEHRYAVERLGLILQLTNTTNSKYRLLYRKGAAKYRKKVAEIIRCLHTIYDDKLFVGCPMPIKNQLIEDGVLDDVLSLHYGTERGMNSAEHCECAMVIGREQPNIYEIEALARAFMMESMQPFRSILDENGEGRLPTYERARRMRDGSVVLQEVTAHPDPVAQLFVGQIREAGVVQMVDRVRAIWNPKLIIVATDVPVDLDIDELMTERELLAELKPAAAIAGRGWRLGRNNGPRQNPVIAIYYRKSPVSPYSPSICPPGTARPEVGPISSPPSAPWR